MVDDRDRNDAELDALITEALDVDVPAEFVAQVRTRLETERARTTWPFAWTVASATTAAAAVLIFWFAYPAERSEPTQAVATVAIPQTPSNVRPEDTPTILRDVTPVERQTEAAPERRAPRTFAGASITPVVIVDTREAVAIRALVTRLREGSLDPPAPRSEPAGVEHTEILIQPITVAPLAFAADLQAGVDVERPQDVDRPQEIEGLE